MKPREPELIAYDYDLDTGEETFTYQRIVDGKPVEYIRLKPYRQGERITDLD